MRRLNSIRGTAILGFLYTTGLALVHRATHWITARTFPSLDGGIAAYALHACAVLGVALALTFHLHLRRRFDLYREGAIAGCIAWCVLEARWLPSALARLGDAYFWLWTVNSLEILAALPLLMWLFNRTSNLRFERLREDASSVSQGGSR
jgi:hypothetical protein